MTVGTFSGIPHDTRKQVVSPVLASYSLCAKKDFRPSLTKTPLQTCFAREKENGKVYFGQLAQQCDGGKKKYGNIVDAAELKANLKAHCIPPGAEDMTANDYPAFLAQRRELMAHKMRAYYKSL